ncbi:MAG: tetratricopeptide repeat protein [Muribaculaceae bacterium]|nr:tetratricopeptide repeat protein [Muribaculaceae bacterium]
MKLLKYLCCAALCASSLLCSAQQINPITKAMLNGYTELLKENPKDYQTLYERAAQYYNLNRYDEAYADLVKALEYTPDKEKALRESELSLMADVAVEMKNYDLALQSINDALQLSPGNYGYTYKMGNILLYLNRPEDAYKVFSSMQSMKSRSQEAYFGMAKACIAMKNFTEAEELMKEAENADATNYLTYCRLGDLYVDMKQPENAATNYLLGFTMAKDSQRPLESLIKLAGTDYNAVATALDFAAEKADNRLPILFLKGNIACESGNYSQADAALTQLLSYPEAKIPGIYARLALSKLGEYDLNGATQAIENAISLGGGAEEYALKSEIDLANGDASKALQDAAKALTLDANMIDAMVSKAKAQIALNDGDGALSTLNEAIMVNPENQEALLLRAYTNQEVLKNSKAAIGDFNRVILEEATAFPAYTYKALAQAKAGKKIDGDATIENALKDNTGKDDYYWGAVYYAQTGNLDKANDLLQKALFNGYQNQYSVKGDTTPWLNLGPIRHLNK